MGETGTFKAFAHGSVGRDIAEGPWSRSAGEQIIGLCISFCEPALQGLFSILVVIHSSALEVLFSHVDQDLSLSKIDVG